MKKILRATEDMKFEFNPLFYVFIKNILID